MSKTDTRGCLLLGLQGLQIAEWVSALLCISIAKTDTIFSDIMG